MSIADQLISRGWVQGTSIDEDGSVCLGWALTLEACEQLGVESYRHSNMPHINDCSRVAQTIIEQRFIGDDHISLVGWNDDADRTFDQVLRVAKQCDEQIEALKSLGK